MLVVGYPAPPAKDGGIVGWEPEDVGSMNGDYDIRRASVHCDSGVLRGKAVEKGPLSRGGNALSSWERLNFRRIEAPGPLSHQEWRARFAPGGQRLDLDLCAWGKLIASTPSSIPAGWLAD